jgi:hypothetical protein
MPSSEFKPFSARLNHIAANRIAAIQIAENQIAANRMHQFN